MMCNVRCVLTFRDNDRLFVEELMGTNEIIHTQLLKSLKTICAESNYVHHFAFILVTVVAILFTT